MLPLEKRTAKNLEAAMKKCDEIIDTAKKQVALHVEMKRAVRNEFFEARIYSKKNDGYKRYTLHLNTDGSTPVVYSDLKTCKKYCERHNLTYWIDEN